MPCHPAKVTGCQRNANILSTTQPAISSCMKIAYMTSPQFKSVDMALKRISVFLASLFQLVMT